MKKVLTMLAITTLACACAQNKAPKVLVLYYSQTDNTKAVAEAFCSSLGADMEAIALEEPYSGTFQETIERCLKEKEEGVLPAIKPLSADIAAYDCIFLGYPVWFGTYAPPIASLLEAVDFSGKKVVPFCTFGSGGLDSSIRDLKAKQPAAEILPGYGVRAARVEAAPAEIDRFLKENGFIEGEYEKLEAFSEVREATPEETAVFDAAVGDYPMINARAEKVSSRPVPGGTEYLFEARDIPRDPAFEGEPRFIKVYVLDLEGADPVFTQVIR